MRKFVAAGITTFDCADIYTGVEELIGQFLKRYGDEINSGELPEVQIHTKYVPDYDSLSTLKEEDTTQVIDRSLRRLGVDQLDLVQFAWWDYSVDRYCEVASHLVNLQKAGKIRYIGITNFDTKRIRELVASGVPITGNQVQFSVIDQRVANDEPEALAKMQIPFLCYGTVAGGLLSDKYLEKPEPKAPLENRSLTKYKLIIDEFGDWSLFQELLKVLKMIGNKYEASISEIACKYILQQSLVAAIIVGARNSSHLTSLSRLDRITLTDSDLAEIEEITNQAQGPKGPFYELERDKKGKHGIIMKYNLNKEKGESGS